MSLSGIGVSPGVVVGTVHQILHVEVTQPIPGNAQSVIAALNAVANDLETRAAHAKLDVAREVLSAQAMIAQDPSLAEAITSIITGDVADVRPGIELAFAGFRSALLSLGGYFAERVADLDEIAHRAVLKLSGLETGDVELTKPSIVVAEDLTPADTAALDLNYALALVVEKGGPTSHTAIVARGLGIPAIVGCQGILDVALDEQILVDGREGIVIPSPSADEIKNRQQAEADKRERANSVTGPGHFSDGSLIQLLGNAGNDSDAKKALDAGADGIGLFRTELLFLDRQSEPSVDDQTEMYRKVFDVMAGKKVILRTLDAGSDKPVPFLNTVEEENPALGVRGWRLTRIANDVIERQLEAIGKAAMQTQAEVWVMAPMIDTPDEAAEFAKRARAHGIKKVGVMIETPAAALLADHILDEVDFASLGTNDLTQYVMAADRLDSRLSDLTSSWHPAVLRAIQRASASAEIYGKQIGVCGEAAANPQLAAVLLGLGVTSLSMAPVAIPEVRGYLAGIDLGACHRAAHAAINARSAEQAREQATAILGD